MGTDTQFPGRNTWPGPKRVFDIEAVAMAPCAGEVLLQRTIDRRDNLLRRLVNSENSYRHAVWALIPPVTKTERHLHLQRQLKSIHEQMGDRCDKPADTDAPAAPETPRALRSELDGLKTVHDEECKKWWERFRQINEQIVILQQQRDRDGDAAVEESSLPREIYTGMLSSYKKHRGETIASGEPMRRLDSGSLTLEMEPPYCHTEAREPGAAMWFEPDKGGADDRSPPADKHFRYLVHLRLSTSQDGSPWVVLPVYVEYRIPVGSSVHRLILKPRSDSDQPNDMLKLRMAPPAKMGKSSVRCIVAVLNHEFGWQSLPDNEGTVFFGEEIQNHRKYQDIEHHGLCVARWDGSDGRRGILALPNDTCTDLTSVQGMEWAVAKSLEQIRLILKTWLIDKKQHQELPLWVAGYLERIDEWKTHTTARRLYRTWKLRRFSGDAGIFSLLQGWAADNELLVTRIQSAQIRVNLKRMEAYNYFAQWMAQRYDLVVIENEHLPGPGPTDKLWQSSSLPGLLSEVLREVCRLNGTESRRGEVRSAGVGRPAIAPATSLRETV